jgi:hypothetical protein
MSMNIMITASRKVTFKNKAGKRSGGIQTENFGTCQTPTAVTYEILKSKDPAQAYIDWVLEEYGQYEDDIWQEHVEEFRAWIDRVEEEGFTVKFNMI